MTFDIITLFPDMFKGPFDESIVKRAQDKKLVEINLHNLRTWAVDKRGSVDDRPYGGGIGMVLRVEPIFNALKDIKRIPDSAGMTILMDPRGKKFNQKMAREYAKLDQLIIICGHYEGVDERVKENLIDEAVSVGDYVLTGGEIPAMIITDAVTRLLPGVLSKEEATQIESFSDENYLEFPQFTRPEDFNGWKVPEILLGGNHAEIKEWRNK
ncbi:MAG: tRNA (guanosine(37)-N1)-methyltransferase TrmD, partial [bacterium]|nr:tRNA (guanosine(37)-N1)-methyltransferase TrmD [bacterium]